MTYYNADRHCVFFNGNMYVWSLSFNDLRKLLITSVFQIEFLCKIFMNFRPIFSQANTSLHGAPNM